jgi:predicted O-methyltransferase YrrM
MKIKKLIKSLIYVFFSEAAIRKLRNDAAGRESAEDYANLAFAFNFAPFKFINIKPSQVRGEILGLLKILKDRKPRAILEIGTGSGGTLYLFARMASPSASLISLDLPGGSFGGGYGKHKIALYRSFAGPNQRIHLLRIDSHEKTAVDKVGEILDNSKLDFLFIDGDHSYEGVKKDFETYSQLVQKGGIVAFHDIVPHPLATGCRVHDFWKEIRQAFRTEEFVEDWGQGRGGIGVVYF